MFVVFVLTSELKFEISFELFCMFVVLFETLELIVVIFEFIVVISVLISTTSLFKVLIEFNISSIIDVSKSFLEQILFLLVLLLYT